MVLNTGRKAWVDAVDLPSLYRQKPNRTLRISRLPVNRQSVVGWVIKLEFKRVPEVFHSPARRRVEAGSNVPAPQHVGQCASQSA